jgi:hypothetical protein
MSEDKKMDEPVTIRRRKSLPADVTDQWFDAQLHRIFFEVASEPLPPDIADLVEKLKGEKRGR